MINKNIQLLFNLKKKKIYEKDDFLVSSSNKVIDGQNGQVEK